MVRRKWIYVLVVLAAGLLCACEKKVYNSPDDDDKPTKPQEEKLQYAAVNINDTTPYADILFACSNGSYMICDVNHDNQCGMLYFNTASSDDIDAGYFIYVDATGTPMMLRTSKGEYYFKNVTENSCDLAYQPYGGEVRYFWGVQTEEEPDPQGVAPRKGTASWGETVSSPFTTWWSEVTSFDWTWDKHQRKAIIPYLAKVTSFAITAVSTVGDGDVIGGLITLYDESLKSGLVDSSLVKYIQAYEFLGDLGTAYKVFTGNIDGDDIKGFAIGYIATKLNGYADNALENSATFDEISWEIFNHPEHHIALSRYMLQFPQSGGIALIKVTAQDGWYLEGWKIPDWISYTVDGNYINLNISTNEDASPRECTILVYPPSGVQPARLTIKQDGCAFAISPQEITFYGKEAHNAILVQASDKVKSWSVKSCPNWLSYETSSMTVWLDTKSSMANRGNQTGTVVIEAVLHEGGKVEQSCAVTWYPDEGNTSWDGTSWIFSGTLSFTDGPDQQISMGLSIHSVATHSATLSIGAYSDIPCSVSENGTYGLKGSFSIYSVSGSFTATRTGETTATCEFEMSGPGDGGQIEHAFGTLTGTKQ